jgi:hypothetical protein
MKHPLRRLFLALVGLVLAFVRPAAAQSTPKPAVPLEPISAILDAFKAHQIVALTDAHGNEQNHAFRLRLIRDPRFIQVVNDIVIELGNAKYQDVADQFVQGRDVPATSLRRIWRDTTVSTAGNNYLMIEELLRTVRELNAGLSRERQIRVLLGDPPVDWDRVHTRDDWNPFFEMRDSYPAALIQIEVLAKQRKALVLYGQMHFQRKSIDSNFDMQTWQAQTIVSLLEAAIPTKVFTIWQADPVAIQPSVASWRFPSIAVVRGTVLGGTDVSVYHAAPSRFTILDGKLLNVAREQFRTLRAEDQFDAVLYLGPASTMVDKRSYEIPPPLCSEPGFLEMQMSRIAMTAPRFEADRLKQYCDSETRRAK